MANCFTAIIEKASDGEYNIGEFMVIDLSDLPIFSPAMVLCGIIIIGMSYCYNYWWCLYDLYM